MQQQGLGIDMRRIAFIGIENADSEVLHEALRRNLGADAEINAFGRDVAAVAVAPFLVAKSKESGQLEGGNSVAYISGEADADLAKKIGRLHKAGVTVRTGWSDFKPDAPEEDIAQWLATGEWPVPAPEPEPEDDEDDLLALMLGDDEDEDEDEVLASISSNDSATTENEEDEASPVSESASSEMDADDELMALAEPVVAAPVYESRRFDSMGANDGVVQPLRRRETAPVEAESLDEDDDDLPLPSFTSIPLPSDAEEERPASFSEDNDDDELPAFGGAASVDVDDEEDSEDLPTFNAATREELPSLRSVDFSDADEDDELPVFTSSPKSDPVADSQKVEFSSAVDDEDELPSWFPTAHAAEDVKQEEKEEVTPPSYLRPVTQEREAFPVEPSFDDLDDELPVFRAPSVASNRGNTESAVSRRTARELPVDSDDDDDELPVFAPVSRDRHEVQEDEKPQAPSYARPPVELDEEEDLPVFKAPAPVAPVAQEDDFFSGDSDDEDLPVFTAPAASEEMPPLRRSRREILQAADSLTVSDSKPSVDDDGEDLPVFTPVFAAVQPEEDDDLPAPVRRASPVNDDERGDDLPDFAARAVKPASAVDEVEEDEEEEDSFEFAPKVKTPRYAAPVEKQPSWGVPVQRPEPVVQPEPVRQEPARKVAPEKVRYEDDNPSEAIAEMAKRRREAEGYVQPEIETDVPDRELRPAPGAIPELRKAPKRVVNQRPAAPIEDESLSFMDGQDSADDFDPDATPPFMESLQPEQRRAQSTMEKIRREYDSESIMKVRSKGSAVCYYVTGSHGGAGKTTSTWMMANTMAAALKKDPSRPVFLIEGDYENSKLAQRLNLPPEKNSGRLAELYRTLSSDRSLISKQKINMFEMTEKIIKESIYVNDHGVNIIAAPYDLTKRDGRFLRIAIQKSVEYAERQGGYVFIDADTLSNDDILDRTLAAKATHVVLVSFGDKDHVDDTHRAIHTLTTANVKSVAGTQSNGMGVPKDRIKLFFNKTGTDRFEDLQRTMRPYLTEGHLPTVPGLNDGGWIGNLTGSDFLNAVTSYASFMNRISPMEELRPYQQRKPGKVTQRSSFMKMFGSRRG